MTAASGVKEKKKERSKQREREKADTSKYVISEGIGKYFSYEKMERRILKSEKS